MKKNGKIGIVVAMQMELDQIKNRMKNIVQKQIYDLIFIEGTIAKKKCVVVKSEVGKVNAARATQVMIDKYKPDFIVNVGAAGATNEKVKVGDIIIGKRIVQHDFDITAFGHSKGYISNIGDLIKSNRDLVTSFEKTLKHLKKTEDFNIKLGIVATGDIFCTEVAMKNKIYAKFNADVTDMECAGIAQVCYLDDVPFIALKSVSSTPYGAIQSYNENINLAVVRCTEVIEKVIENIE